MSGPDFVLEALALEAGAGFVAGVDEVGRELGIGHARKSATDLIKLLDQLTDRFDA